MYYVNAKHLVELAIANGVLQTKDNGIFIYRSAGADPEQYPEGWYLEDAEDVIRDIMDDEKGQTALIAALAEKGVTFVPRVDETHVAKAIKELSAIVGPNIRFEERRPGEFWAMPPASRNTKGENS